MQIDSSIILRTYKPIPLTPQAFRLMSSGWKPPISASVPDFTNSDLLPADRITKLREVITHVESLIADADPNAEGMLLHNNMRLPLIELRQNLTNEVRANMPRTNVQYSEARKVIEEILYAAIKKRTGDDHQLVNDLSGYKDEVEVVSACLADAEGQEHETHGISRILDYAEAVIDGRIDPKGIAKLEKAENGKLYFDGGGTFGQVAVQYALQESLNYMDENDSAALVVTLRNAYHAGRLEWILRQAVRRGYDCLAMFNVGGWGRTGPEPDGMEPRWGTNPIGIGVTTGIDEDGSVGDIATVARPEGWVRVAFLAGLGVPLNVVRSPDGHPLIETEGVYRKEGVPDMILPLGGDIAAYKGAVLGEQIELFVDAVSGRGPDDENKPKGNNLVLVLSRANDSTIASTNKKLEVIESCPTASGKPVRRPGREGIAKLTEAQSSGLNISTEIWDKILVLHREMTKVE